MPPTPPMPCRVLTVTIRRPPAEVCAFAGDPLRLPQWASGLASRVLPQDDHWIIPTPKGDATLHFTPPNPQGVLDHQIVQPNGARIDVPMRVVPNGPDASEVIFVLFQQPAMTDEAFERDAAMVDNDLKTLRALLEAPPPPPEVSPAPEAPSKAASAVTSETPPESQSPESSQA